VRVRFWCQPYRVIDKVPVMGLLFRANLEILEKADHTKCRTSHSPAAFLQKISPVAKSGKKAQAFQSPSYLRSRYPLPHIPCCISHPHPSFSEVQWPSPIAWYSPHPQARAWDAILRLGSLPWPSVSCNPTRCHTSSWLWADRRPPPGSLRLQLQLELTK